jgi:oligopeptidase B
MDSIPPRPPMAEVRPMKLKKHGDVRVDDYFWLKNRDGKDVIAYIKAENEYVDRIMKPTLPLQERLIKEMRARMKEDDESAPYKKGNCYYFSRYVKGAEYPLYLRRQNSAKGKEELLLDVNVAAQGHKFFDVSRIAVSYDQNLLVYGADTVGRRFYDLHFKDLSTGKLLSETVKSTSGNVIWLNDNKTILYTQQDPETLRSYQVFKYTLGGGKPILIYTEKDPQFSVSVSKDLTQNFVYINCASNSANEVRYADATGANLNFHIFSPREKKHEYSISDGGDRFFILSNLKAKNFQLLQTPINKTSKANWQTVVAHRKNVLLEDVLILKNYIVLQARENGLTQLMHFARAKGLAQSTTKKWDRNNTISFPDPTYVASLGTNAEYDTDYFRYDYQSLTQPETVFDFDFKNIKSVKVKTAEVPGYNPELYTSERQFAKAKDGTKIPVSIVYKKSLYKKSGNPLYVYAYGSYGYSTDTYFRRGIVSLLDRGFIFAIAHVRGGSEMGREWYDRGKLMHKKNTFSDFISATEFLLKKGYGQREHVYAMGGSAGGLLMGAVLNMRPDLYNGVIAAVPFVDVVTTMLDDSIPLTTNEYDEWGNPNIKKFYNYIKSYSPYDNVKKQNYPNILVTTGYHDSQVQYWEPTKWVAKLRKYNASENLILFKTDMESGHSGITGRFESLKEDALDYAFFLMLEKRD